MPENVLHGLYIGLVHQNLKATLQPAAGVLLELVPVFVGLAHAAPTAGDSGVPFVILQVYMPFFEQMLQKRPQPGKGHVRAIEAGVLQPGPSLLLLLLLLLLILMMMFLCHGVTVCMYGGDDQTPPTYKRLTRTSERNDEPSCQDAKICLTKARMCVCQIKVKIKEKKPHPIPGPQVWTGRETLIWATLHLHIGLDHCHSKSGRSSQVTGVSVLN